ncbi:hypothetical protein GWI33_022454 [Rhynchophorus ferrugineus]|uniref:Uncharacterized protein n=1 Tax=Rhynchophorus ferrugineus TaxID=354439 RepID=A0A834MMJ6_RHYFE|nr:hypothetical protein GWI33_022454 [Rhynchophorus ferrugineus]
MSADELVMRIDAVLGHRSPGRTAASRRKRPGVVLVRGDVAIIYFGWCFWRIFALSPDVELLHQFRTIPNGLAWSYL